MEENTSNNTKKLTPFIVVVAEALGLAVLPFLVFFNYNYKDGRIDFTLTPTIMAGIVLYAICAFGIAVTRRRDRTKTHLFVKGYFALVSIDLTMIGATAILTEELTIRHTTFCFRQAVYLGAAHVFRVLTHCRLHGQSRIASTGCMIFMRYRGAKQCHDAVS